MSNKTSSPHNRRPNTITTLQHPIRLLLAEIHVFPKIIFGAQEAADFAKIRDFAHFGQNAKNGHFWGFLGKMAIFGGSGQTPPKSGPPL